MVICYSSKPKTDAFLLEAHFTRFTTAPRLSTVLLAGSSCSTQGLSHPFSILHPWVISPRLTALQFMSPDKTSLILLDSGLLGTATAVSEKHPKSIQPKRTPDTPPSASLVSIMSTNINAAAEAANEESFVTPAPPPHPIPRVLTPPPPKVTLLFSSSLLPSSLTKIANHCNSLGLVSLSVTEQPEDGSANKKPTLDLSLLESPPSSDFRLLKKSQVLVPTKDLKT